MTTPDIPNMPTEQELQRPATLRQKLEMAARFSAVVAATVPPTSLPPMVLTAITYKRFRDEKRFHRWHHMLEWAHWCSRHIMKADVRVEGLHRMPQDTRRLMWVSNHQSYVDIPVIMGALRIGAFLSKDLVAYIPVLGWIAWLGGTIYFNRRSPESRRKALSDVLRMCEESTPVVVFPEGTRSKDGELRTTVRMGALRSCWERDIRIATFAIDGTRYVFPPSMDRMYTGQRVAIVVGETLEPADFLDADAYASAAWDSVRQCFERARQMRLDPDWEHYPAT